jgi:hypothetical protein
MVWRMYLFILICFNFNCCQHTPILHSQVHTVITGQLRFWIKVEYYFQRSQNDSCKQVLLPSVEM